MPFVFAFTLFLSATLLFLVQPMIAKMILPKLGGTPAVWNTCMVFFQAALLAGYAYAHATTNWLGSRRQAVVHLVVLGLPILVLPIVMSEALIPPGDANPIPWLLGILILTAGLPFFVVSTSAPLLQKWFADTGHPAAKDPYFLYAASNVGSMIALVGYPLFVEPRLRLADQADVWRWGYYGLALLTLVCAAMLLRAPQRPPTPVKPQGGPPNGAPTWGRRLYWVALAFVPSSLMLGVTVYITTDIAAIPLLWVIPLALYLLSFIIVFAQLPPVMDKLVLIALLAACGYTASTFVDPEQTYFGVGGGTVRFVLRAFPLTSLVLLHPRIPPVLHKSMVMMLPVVLLLLVYLMRTGSSSPRGEHIVPLITLHLTALFMTAMVCHGELAQSRPSPRYLTEFYLLMSLGGVLGGMFNALFAPLAFVTLAEYPLAMVMACLLLPNFVPEAKGPRSHWMDLFLTLTPGVLGVALFIMGRSSSALAANNVTNLFGDHRLRTLALGVAVAGGLLAYVLYRREDRAVRGLDVLAAGSLGLLAAGLAIGVPASGLTFASLTSRLRVKEEEFRTIVMYGLPVLLCYTLIARPVRFGLSIGALLLAGAFVNALDSDVVYRDRSFFGVLTVEHRASTDSNRLVHGTTLHGEQFCDEERRHEALTYYHKTGPIGRVFEAFQGPDLKKEVALIGLGTGTLTSYGRPGQKLTIYEIDRNILMIARDTGLFTYFNDCKADKEVVLGDARLRMREARDGQYGLIAVDAFSSDAIPIHLITKEAVELFVSKLDPTGIVAYHISNRYLDLEPVLANIKKELELEAVIMKDDDEDAPGKSSSTWVLMARKRSDFGKLVEPGSDEAKNWHDLKGAADVGVWTDDYSNLLSVFNRKPTDEEP